MAAMDSAEQIGQQEIRDAIAFYSARGWDWLNIVCFLALKNTGRLEAYLKPHTRYAARRVEEGKPWE